MASVLLALAALAGMAHARAQVKSAHASDSPNASCWCGIGSAAAATDARASILLFGDAVDAIEPLRVALQELGHAVTVEHVLPEDLLPYDTIWHVGNTEPLMDDERQRLVRYVAAGGGLHLTGERSGSDTMNDSLALVVGEVVAADGIQVGRLGDVLPPGSYFGTHLVNPDVLGGIASNPNEVSEIKLLTPGGLGGIALDRNVLAEGDGGVPVGAVWEGSDLACANGALSILMDNGWLEVLPHDTNSRAFLENLQTFLTRSTRACLDGDADGVTDDVDACPGTTAGAVVDGAGCSIADLCPCQEGWKNHGAYVSCVAQAANDFFAAGLSTAAEEGEIVSHSARSLCGRQTR